MNLTDAGQSRRGTLASAADLLRKAADGYRTGEIAWGRERLIDDEGRRCLVAAICWAADPDDTVADGNPHALRIPTARHTALVALTVVAEHLVLEEGWQWVEDGIDEPNLIDTVGEWQDRQDVTVLRVIRLLETVAEVLRPASLDVAS